ncbi:hypothetical protein HY988_04075 [Candidatus Micrarchaeota archaeon]|nr:hypothetical protein [Candidatus Micrarchaeota archaeon]
MAAAQQVGNREADEASKFIDQIFNGRVFTTANPQVQAENLIKLYSLTKLATTTAMQSDPAWSPVYARLTNLYGANTLATLDDAFVKLLTKFNSTIGAGGTPPTSVSLGGSTSVAQLLEFFGYQQERLRDQPEGPFATVMRNGDALQVLSKVDDELRRAISTRPQNAFVPVMKMRTAAGDEVTHPGTILDRLGYDIMDAVGSKYVANFEKKFPQPYLDNFGGKMNQASIDFSNAYGALVITTINPDATAAEKTKAAKDFLNLLQPDQNGNNPNFDPDYYRNIKADTNFNNLLDALRRGDAATAKELISHMQSLNTVNKTILNYVEARIRRETFEVWTIYGRADVDIKLIKDKLALNLALGIALTQFKTIGAGSTFDVDANNNKVPLSGPAAFDVTGMSVKFNPGVGLDFLNLRRPFRIAVSCDFGWRNASGQFITTTNASTVPTEVQVGTGGWKPFVGLTSLSYSELRKGPVDPIFKVENAMVGMIGNPLVDNSYIAAFAMSINPPTKTDKVSIKLFLDNHYLYLLGDSRLGGRFSPQVSLKLPKGVELALTPFANVEYSTELGRVFWKAGGGLALVPTKGLRIGLEAGAQGETGGSIPALNLPLGYFAKGGVTASFPDLSRRRARTAQPEQVTVTINDVAAAYEDAKTNLNTSGAAEKAQYLGAVVDAYITQNARPRRSYAVALEHLNGGNLADGITELDKTPLIKKELNVR